VIADFIGHNKGIPRTFQSCCLQGGNILYRLALSSSKMATCSVRVVLVHQGAPAILPVLDHPCGVTMGQSTAFVDSATVDRYVLSILQSVRLQTLFFAVGADFVTPLGTSTFLCLFVCATL
jgi:hypothetical protein